MTCALVRPALIGGLALVLLGREVAHARQELPPDPTRTELEAQKVLNQELLRRLESLEANQQVRLEQDEPGPAAREAEQATEEATSEPWRLPPVLAGYFDFEYFDDDRSKSPGTFRHHRLSLHLSKELGQFRLFSEVEFEYGTKFEGDGGTQLEEARGELKLEQAWGECSLSDLLVLRGGHILTPLYWTVNHYPNVVLPTRRPLMVNRVFPEAFTGVMGYGSAFREDLGLTYHLFVGNGESEFSTKQDDNDGKAVGGHLTLHLPRGDRFFTLDIGAGGYVDDPTDSERVEIWGLDAQVRAGGFELLAEFAQRDSSDDRTGLYVQPSYRWNEEWAAFYRFDRLEAEDDDAREHTLGLNFRPIPPVSIKLEGFRSLHSPGEDFNGIATSIAIAF